MAAAGFTSANPLMKVADMLTDFKGKLASDGAAEAKQFEEYSDWCHNESKDKNYAIETGKAKVSDLSAELEELHANIGSLNSEITDLASAIQKNEADLKSAKQIREQEVV